jgi:hypothetical protein
MKLNNELPFNAEVKNGGTIGVHDVLLYLSTLTG